MTFAPPSAPVTPNRTLRTVLLVVGSIALALTVVTAVGGVARAAFAAGGDGGDGTRVLAGEVASVRVEAAIADLTVRLADVDEPTIEWDSGTSGLRLRSDLRGGELTARVDGDGWGLFGWLRPERGPASLEILLPERAAGADLDVDGTAGAVLVDGDWGDVELESTVGDVRLIGGAASLDLRSTAGNTSGEGLEIAEVAVEATAGNVDLGFGRAPAALDAQTTAGELRIALPAGEYELRTETTLGDVTSAIASTGGAERSYRLTSTVGDIEIALAG